MSADSRPAEKFVERQTAQRRIGTVMAVRVDRGFAFIQPDHGGRDVFAFYADFEGIEFDAQLQERRVSFTTIETAKGPKAKAIRPAD